MTSSPDQESHWEESGETEKTLNILHGSTEVEKVEENLAMADKRRLPAPTLTDP